MAHEESSQQQTPTATQQQPPQRTPAVQPVERPLPTGGRINRTPSAPIPTIRSLPLDLQISQEISHANEVVLVFEAEFSVAEARSWTGSYNLKNAIQLTVIDELP